MRTTVTFVIDSDILPDYSDEQIAQLWHIAQANTAEFGDVNACHLAEYIGQEIIRRWLVGIPPELRNHQGSNIKNPVAMGKKAQPDTTWITTDLITEWLETKTGPVTVDEVIIQALSQEPTKTLRKLVAAELDRLGYSKVLWRPPYQSLAVKAYAKRPSGTITSLATAMNGTPIYIDGPQGCGKTHHAPALAAALGCTSIVDGDEVEDPGVKPLVIGKIPPICPKGAVAIQVFDSEGLHTLLTSLRPSES